MLGLTADIADELLQIKDSERNSLTDDLKLKIISLAELAASPELDQPEPEAVPEPAPAPVAPEPVATAPVVPEPEEPAAPELPEVEEPIIPEPEIHEPEVVKPESEVLEVTEPEATETVAIPDFDIAETVEWVDDEAPAEDEATEAPIEPEIPQAPKTEPEPAKLLIDPKELQRAFSINDAFLFRREIFGGSKQEFDRALNHIATLSDYHQLQHFLVETLNLNLNKAPGKEFYQLLVGFFK
jgi:hypothetical protein